MMKFEITGLESTLIVLILCLFAILSCNRPNSSCEYSESAVNYLENKIQMIQSEYTRTNGLTSDLVRAAFLLEKISGIKASIEWGDVSYYPSINEVENDISNWEQWVDRNRCNLEIDSIKRTDSLIMVRTDWIL